MKTNLHNLATYCLTNNGSIDPSFISNSISINGAKSNALKLSISKFTGLNLSSNCAPCPGKYVLDKYTCGCSCSLGCNSMTEIANFQSCECSAFARAHEINNLKSKIQNLYGKVQTSFGNGNDTNSFFTQLLDLLGRSSNFQDNMKWNFNDLNMTEQVQMVDDFSSSYANLEKSFDGYLRQQWGTCSNGCEDRYVLLASDCSCFMSNATNDYFNLLYGNASFDHDILTYQGPGSADELQGFVKRTKEVRDKLHTLYEYLANTGANYNQSYFETQKNEISNTIETLLQDWNAWKSGKTTTTTTQAPCAENCNLNTQIADKSSCQCVTINGWDTIQGYPNTFDSINNQINALSNVTAKTQLRENL